MRDGKVITAAGVSAGLDLGLWLVGEIAGRARAEATQLCIEYDPQPPFDTGHISKASLRHKADAARVIKTMISAREAGAQLAAGSKVLWKSAIDRARVKSADSS
ncbi:ThiJ/PfpI domain-containing protein [Mycobacteroides abscessus subsp. bolletii]|nr:ThiJ/PfpI domain-containing protein [Mycobacteroides abscessus subsp. bolletii]